MAKGEPPLKAPMPQNLTLERSATGLQLSYLWRSWSYVFSAIFAVVWNVGIFYMHKEVRPAEDDLLFDLFLILFVFLGVSVAYFALGGLLNRTKINVTPYEVSVKHGPLPSFGNRRIQAREIRQLYCEEVVRHYSDDETGDRTRVSYRLNASLKDGRTIKLLSDLDSSDLALFLEQEIEKQLNIRDEPVVRK